MFLSIIENMPRPPPIVFPQEQRLLAALGERLRLARKRRKLSNAIVAQRAGISRTTLYKVEAGAAGATLGSYVRVLAVLGLESDLDKLAADDKVGRKLQDLALAPSSTPAPRPRKAKIAPLSSPSSPPPDPADSP
jgi:transcriptional regulator with XRE-family HTH domain